MANKHSREKRKRYIAPTVTMHFRIDPKVLEEIDRLGFSTRADFVRFAVNYTLRKFREAGFVQGQKE